MTTDYPRGYRPSPREQEYNSWIDGLYAEAKWKGYELEIDGDHAEFWDGDNLIDAFDFESYLDHPSLSAWERNATH